MSLINFSWHVYLIRGKPRRSQRVPPQVETLMIENFRVEKFLFTSGMKSLGLKWLKCPATVFWP